MSNCVFCEGQDDLRNRKIYNTCDIVAGTSCIPCVEYMEMEAQAEKTRQILREQLTVRREMRENINRLHDPMVRRIPRDVIAQIFVIAARIDVASDGTDSLRDGEIYAPLPLGWICGAWRRIAWGIPQLWTFISVRIRTIEQFASRFDMAKQWLLRSGEDLPLSIDFRINETCTKFSKDEETFLPFIYLLNHYSHRWKDFCGHCPGDLFRHLIANPLGVPILQNLQLSSPYYSELGNIFGVGDDNLPQPRSLRLSNVFLLQDSGVAWGQIRYLTLDIFPAVKILEVLPLLPNLWDLTILGVIEHDWPRRQPNIVYHYLDTFNMECSNSTYYQEMDELHKLLNYLIFPSLRYLSMNLHYNLKLNDVTSLIQRSSCKLSSLSLASIPLDRQGFDPSSSIDIFQYLDSLKFLEITATSADDRYFLQGLYNCLRRQPVFGFQRRPLSNLQHFKYIASLEDIPWDLLFAIFDREWCAHRPQWRTLSIVHWEPEPQREEQEFEFDDEVIFGLLDLVNAGIEIIIPRQLDVVMRARLQI